MILIDWLIFVGYLLVLPAALVFGYTLVLWLTDKYVDRSPLSDNVIATAYVLLLLGVLFFALSGAVALYPDK